MMATTGRSTAQILADLNALGYAAGAGHRVRLITGTSTEGHGMDPVLIHDDDSTCHHHGPAVATVHHPDGPRCSAGQLITHVRFNGQTLTVTEAYHAVMNLAATFTAALQPLACALAAACDRLAEDPAIQALAAAAQVITRARIAEASTSRTGGRDTNPPSLQSARGMTGDPCGGEPL
jgi:hypothetical protein